LRRRRQLPRPTTIRRRNRANRYRDDDDVARERLRGTGGYDPYEDRRRGPGGYGSYGGYGGERWAEEYGGRRSNRSGGPAHDDEDGWQRDRGRAVRGGDEDDGQYYGRGAMRSRPRGASGWYGTRDYDRFGGRRYGSESMGGTIPGAASMAGKGPKGYQRSDERIRDDVCDCLTDDPRLDASGIDVKVKSGEVTLSGSVDSRQAKRHAEELIDRVSGVRDVHNGLRVQESRGRRAVAHPS
jgi:hypothetical protein